MIGRFVADNKYGPSKVVGVDGNNYAVEYFFSPWNKKIVIASKKSVAPLRLYKQTRVYVEVDGRWRMGRVVLVHEMEDGYEYEIQFPNQHVHRYSERDIYTRCWAEHDDPTATLSGGGMETPYFYERRQKFTDTLLAERNATRGLTAILSSRIDLVPHQIEVARRVLEDPLQRYLLADEVGMGKTIEAGMIIRQYLLSNSGGGVVVIAPDVLVRQWERELQGKFMIDEFDQGVTKRVRIVSSNRLSEISSDGVGLLVVDEAHHLVSGEIPKELSVLAHDIPRLLLLSATPALGNTDVLLRLLKLLDPACYNAVNSAEFSARLERLDRYGVFLRGLRSSASTEVLNQRLRRVPELFAGDEDALRLSQELNEALARNDEESVSLSIAALRLHVSDVYRIHQRLIRTRRSDASEWFFPRGPVIVPGGDISLDHVTLLPISDSRIQAIFDLFEDWRLSAISDESSELLQSPDLSKYAGKLFAALGCSVECFSDVLAGVPLEYMGEEWRDAFINRSLPPNNYESRPLQVAKYVQSYLGKLALEGVRRPRIAVFGSDDNDLRLCVDSLRSLMGDEVIMYAGEFDYDDEDDVASSFRDSDDVSVLCCGMSEEEGINLHFVDAIIHLDLPFNPSRIEQRIGRLDRYGRTKSRVLHTVLLPEIDAGFSPWHAWYDVLAMGFQVFNEPIADVQFALEGLSLDLREALLRGGAEGLRKSIGRVQERITSERERLDAQYALDGVLQREDLAGGMYNAIDNYEEGELAIAHSLKGWVGGVLQLPIHGDIRDCFSLSFNEGTLLPPWPWAQCFDRHGFRDSHTCIRQKAVRDVPPPKLLRRGGLLMRCIEQVYKIDDRGSAFGMWRNVLDRGEDEFVAFKLCYIIEAQLPEGLTQDEKNGYRARLDGYLPPWVDSLFVDPAQNIISDPVRIKQLSLPYDITRDSSLGSRLDDFFNLIDEAQFSRLCLEVRASSESSLRSHEKFRDAVKIASTRAKIDIERRNARLNQRLVAHSLMSPVEESGICRERELNEQMVMAIQDPHIKLDSIGVIVLSSRTLGEEES